MVSPEILALVGGVLRVLYEATSWRAHGLSVVEISRRCDLTLDQIYTACRFAVQEGYLEVLQSNETRRAVRFILTPKGEHLMQSVTQSPLRRPLDEVRSEGADPRRLTLLEVWTRLGYLKRG